MHARGRNPLHPLGCRPDHSRGVRPGRCPVPLHRVLAHRSVDRSELHAEQGGARVSSPAAAALRLYPPSRATTGATRGVCASTPTEILGVAAGTLDVHHRLCRMSSGRPTTVPGFGAACSLQRTSPDRVTLTTFWLGASCAPPMCFFIGRPQPCAERPSSISAAVLRIAAGPCTRGQRSCAPFPFPSVASGTALRCSYLRLPPTTGSSYL